MFSAKNYGLPKDLIEAAKRVHEKQLEEQQKPTSLRQAVGRVGLAIRGVIPKRATKKPSPEQVYKAMGGSVPERAKKPQTEEVQFTEEELAEAFAIFLEENFHVEMLTEEDLDYVFEEEFPQWLEEQGGWFGMGGFPGSNTPKSGEQQKRRTAPVSSRKPGAGNAALEAKRDAYMRKNPSSPSVRRVKAAQAKSTASNVKRGARAEDRRIQSPRNSAMNDVSAPAIKKIPTGQHELDAGRPTSTPTAPKPAAPKPAVRKPALNARRPAPKIDYKTPVTRRGSDGTYQLTSKGRRYVARKEAQERKKPFSASKFFSQMQQDGN